MESWAPGVKVTSTVVGNADPPKSFIVEGKTILFQFGHSSKAYLPIFTYPSGIVTEGIEDL